MICSILYGRRGEIRLKVICELRLKSAEWRVRHGVGGAKDVRSGRGESRSFAGLRSRPWSLKFVGVGS